MVKRTALIIKYFNKKALVEIEKLVQITYHSKKMKYAISYCNKSDFEDLKKSISKINGVKKVEETLVDMSVYDFEE